MTLTPKNAIDGDIALFLADAGSRHQTFSKRALQDYLEAEGHDEPEILSALQSWSPIWVGDAKVEDRFHLEGDAWTQVASLQSTGTPAV